MKNIFISSTFRDMHAERDLVQERVLPALRTEARKYGDNVEVIDLRWGVDTSMLETDEGSAKVLTVCLDEIERSHPYMLIFLGERYGWIPKGELIEKAVKGREDKYITDDFEKSVTALEIEYGALSEKYGDVKHCVVCFRELVTEGMDAETKRIYTEQEEKGIQKLRELKERIRKDLGEEGRLITYTGTWDVSAHTLADLQANGEPLEEVLTKCYINMFQQDWKEYEILSWQEKEQLGFKALMESKLRSFVGREALLEDYYQKAVSGTGALVLQGEVGSGKTALMCRLAERLQKEGKNVFTFFSGTGSMSNSAQLLVQQMLYYVEDLLGIEKHLGMEEDHEEDSRQEYRKNEYEKKSEYDSYLIYLKAQCNKLQEKVYFCIDALDQLYGDEHVEKLDFLLEYENVQMILSCTNTFVIPPVTIFQIQKESIPPLSIEDAKAVTGGILKSYSRDVYEEIEQEIVKKKNMGSPLYISLIIRRLNMMDQDELEQLYTGEEIKAYSVNLIREIPEEVDEAAGTILKDAVDKISQGNGCLQEALYFLAVSRNGLRMSDLQKLFESSKDDFSVLDFTLLMKYLDGFFYIGEDDRIDVTHKIIRQGLLREIPNQANYEERIKEHMKSLDSLDCLRMQEGLYYARVTKDYNLANAIFQQTYETQSEFLNRMIIKEAVEDEGGFCCELLQKEGTERKEIKDLFLWKLLERFELSQKEMKTRMRIAQALADYLKDNYESSGSEVYLKELSISYCKIGDAFYDQGKVEEALVYYKKMRMCLEELCESQGSSSSLKDLSVSFDRIGDALYSQGKSEEALFYYEKSLKCAEELHESQESQSSLRELSVCYRKVGNTLYAQGRDTEALPYFEKALNCTKKIYESQNSERNLRALSINYNNIGDVLLTQEKEEEALVYYEKALRCTIKLQESQRSQTSLRDLLIGVNKMGNALHLQGKEEKALAYYEKALNCAIELQESQRSQMSLRDLFIAYKNLGNVYLAQERIEETLLCYEKSLTYAKELHEIQQSQTSLRELAISYKDMGEILRAQEKNEEAFVYYEKALRGMEEVHEKQSTPFNLQELSKIYDKMGALLHAQGQLEESFLYYKKSLDCMEEFHESQKNERSLRALLISYNNMGDILYAQGKMEEAQACYEKILSGTKKLYESQKSQRSLQELSISYKKMGYVLYEQGRLEEVLEYFKKSLYCNLLLYESQKSLSGLQEVCGGYDRIGNIYYALERVEEALLYYEKSLSCMEILYESQKSQSRLEDLVNTYNIMINILCDLGRKEEALIYYAKSLSCREEMQGSQGKQPSLLEQIMEYDKMGDDLRAQGRLEEALSYYEKSLGCAEEIYANEKSMGSLQDLGISYMNIGSALCDLERLEEALSYYEKGLRCVEEVHVNQRNRSSLQTLLAGYSGIVKLLSDMGREEEAILYYMKALRYKEEFEE